ncbi:Trp biosynthesis-associated membrane protein [Gryllotalpicola ginsengisoli]|uniref:Trp biosynthesis-associated membrane protein n=1 Tax=Gryllotalpicola ginsengisoli TaxID=444608 RepID=UPI0003B700D2|nr:Trp biosynthesis-associated membrane protein [Gryllotalpicola ginsengisoli]
MRNGRSLKLATIVAVIVGAGIGLSAATQTWYTVHLTRAANHTAPVVVDGSTASPALTALSLAGLALALALAIAGRIARIVVGVLGIAVGACIVLAAAGSPADSSGVRDTISQATGIAGTDALRALIASTDASAWPALAIAGGVLIGLGALAAVLTGRLWPGGSKRYDAVRFEHPEAPAGSAGPAADEPARRPAERPGDAAVDDWDDLTRGEDPTR